MFFFQKMPTFKAFSSDGFCRLHRHLSHLSQQLKRNKIFVFSFSFYIPGLSGRPFAGSLRSNLKNIPAKLFASISV
jgi:hypothetical protein